MHTGKNITKDKGDRKELWEEAQRDDGSDGFAPVPAALIKMVVDLVDKSWKRKFQFIKQQPFFHGVDWNGIAEQSLLPLAHQEGKIKNRTEKREALGLLKDYLFSESNFFNFHLLFYSLLSRQRRLT